MGYVIGVDIGGTKCAVLRASASDMTLYGKERFDTCVERGFSDAYGRIVGAVEAAVAACPEKPAAIGISCGGPLNARLGVIQSPPNLPGWDDVPIVADFERRFGIPTFLQNDANACALVEWRYGAGRGVQNMVFLTMGSGMGAGIIANGRLLEGASGMAGEIGHVRLHSNGPAGYGKAGSFEGFTGGNGIAMLAEQLGREWAAQGDAPIWAGRRLSVKELAQLAHAGDPHALRLFEQVGEHLGAGLAILCDLLNPERIVIGSIYARCEGLLRPAAMRALRREALPQTYEQMQLLPAATGEQIGDLASVVTAQYGLQTGRGSKGEETDMQTDTALCKAIKQVTCAFRSGHKLLVCGNGGSAADSAHIVGELVKGFLKKRPLPEALSAELEHAPLQMGLPAIDLTAQSAVISAIGNDLGGECVYAQQVLAYAKAGDVLLGISTSGNAQNVLLALKTAKALGVYCIAMTGKGGGRMADAADLLLAAPETETYRVQETHIQYYHELCAKVEAAFFAE